ncbi:sulfite exporter TauE/SafE family protein [Sphingomonas immobilis]|uniref:Probable membrane transporter protein n=1 Tax=Sphingomonas immobilis TaxID=3063997 RepID=A0ABT8ZTM1_9SPHN|nr:sulfite exporter TauE/SafE family protein [Sphingomonas sp. CA1-15]MDO7840910.1 sulfite exporter TauE/SafE family protein [Sphingomonas sp. CA1-15]
MIFSAINPLYSLAGLAVGILVGLTGVGGGSLMTPLLVLAFGFHPVTAVGTDLLYASATKAVGTGVHGFNRTVDWAVVRRLATGSVPATILTLIALNYAGKHYEGTTHAITIILGVTLILTAIAMLFRGVILARLSGATDDLPNRRIAALTVVLGAVLGILVSLTSVGAGAIGMTALLALYPRLPTNRLVGSDIAHAVPLTLIAGMGHWFLGAVDLGLLASLLIGSIPGIIAGSLLSARVPDVALRTMLAITLVLVGVKLLF